MLFREIIIIYSEDDTKYINIHGEKMQVPKS
jgi:hypothetical protein